MIPTIALIPVVLLLSLGVEAVPSNRQSWGRASRRGLLNPFAPVAPAPAPATTTAAAPAASTTQRASGDLQTFNTGAGGVYAPPVTASNGLFYSQYVPYNALYDALVASCNTQATNCLLSWNVPDVTVCWGSQDWACTNNAQTAANAYSSSAVGAASSAAAYSKSSSAAAYSASSASASASAYSAQQSAASAANAYSSSVNAYSSSASAYSASASAYSASSKAAAAKSTAASSAAATSAAASKSSAASSAASVAASSSSAAPASATAGLPTMARYIPGDVQTFTIALGGIPAPAVTGALGNWWVNGLWYQNLIDALTQSCNSQQGTCDAASWVSFGAFTSSQCDNVQAPACLSAAKSIASSYGASSTAPAATSSAAPTNNGASASAASWSAQQQSASAYSSYVAQYSAQQSASAYSAQQSAAAYSAQQSAAAYSASSSAAAYSAQQSAAAYSASASAAAYSAQQSAAAYSQSVASASAAQSAAAYSASAAAYSQSVAAAAAQQSAAAYSASAAAYSAQQSVAAYSQSVAAAAAQQSAAAYSASAAAYSAQQSVAAYSQSVAAASAAQQSAAAYSASAAAYSASQTVAAYSASVSAAAYSASSSVAAYSASVSAAAAQATVVPSGWSIASTPCIAEGTTGRALISDSTSGSGMTWQQCTSYCGGKGYPLAGLEYSSECFCGTVLSNGASLNNPSSQCNMYASGNNLQIAGGPNAITLFVSNSINMAQYTPDLSGMIQVLPAGWNSVTSGSNICIVEGTTGRALAAASTASDDMTNAKCIAFCSAKGMQYAGTEYSRECYCGNDLVNGASLGNTATCNMQCAGGPGTICGGPGLLSVYQNPSLAYTKTQVGAYKKQGCIQEVPGRALTGAMIDTPDMTIEKCTSYCQQNGFAFAGLEYASQCFCGNTLSNGGSLSSFSTQCNMQCAGDQTENCGGPDAILLYSTDAGLAMVGA